MMKINPEMSKFTTWLYRILRILFAILLVVSTLDVGLQIFMRYVLHHPLPWTEQLARMLFTWMMMLAIPVMFYGRTYLSFDLLLDALPQKVQNWIQLLIDIIILFFCIYVTNSGIALIRSTDPKRIMYNVKVPYVFMYYSLVIGMGLSIIIIVDHTRLTIKKCFGIGKEKEVSGQ